MMKAKRYAIALACMVCCLVASAQFRYAPIAGVTVTNLKFSQNLVDVDQVVGGQAGLQCELMFPGIGFGIDFGLLYNMAGANMHLGDKLMWSSQGYGTERIFQHQLHVPLHLRFKYSRLDGLEDTVMPFVYGGPDFNILVGHSKCEAMEWAGGNLSLTAGVGAELLRKWQISASYSWGMTYAMKAKVLTDYAARPNQWTVRVAYFF